MSELVIAENVSRVFKMKNRCVKAVDNVSIVIKEGTFNILCGRSGSGKTTLLNILAAIDTPTEGKVFFGGKDITAVSEKYRDNIRRKDMGIVFQNTALMSNMSAVENVEFALSLAGVKASGRRKLAISWLEKMGIRERRNHMPAEMSGGEQARVAIGRALAHSPKLLLADEPTSELDSATSFTVVKLLRELVDKEGLTVIMTTHDVNIMDIADNVYTMEDGRITDVREVKESC